MRTRNLSDEGINLFNIALIDDKYGEDDGKYKRKSKKKSTYCSEIEDELPAKTHCYSKIKKMLHDIWTTDYDIELDMTKCAMRNSSKTLYSYLINKNNDMLPHLINNAVINLIMLILTKDKTICKYNQIKINYGFYCNLALKAKHEKDHQTALLILCALQHTCFHILKIKEKYKKKINELELTYGTPVSCYSKHMNDFLNVDDYNYLPSAMIMQMQLRKMEEQGKGMKFIKKNTNKLEAVRSLLIDKIGNYREYYKQNKDIIDIYNLNPFQQFDILLSFEGEKINTILFNLVKTIKQKNKIK